MGKSGRLDAEEKVFFFVVTWKTSLCWLAPPERDPLPSRPLMALCSHAHPVRPLASYGDQRIPAPFLHVLGFSSTQHGPNSTEPSAASIFGASTPIFGATAPLSGASATAPDATASLEGGGRLLRSRLPS